MRDQGFSTQNTTLAESKPKKPQTGVLLVSLENVTQETIQLEAKRTARFAPGTCPSGQLRVEPAAPREGLQNAAPLLCGQSAALVLGLRRVLSQGSRDVT